jgi:hypothetical protein
VIIALTGVIGAGKSTIAKSFSPTAFVVHADVVQHDAVRRAFPFVRRDREYSWNAWPRNIDTMHMNRLLNLSLRSTHHGLLSHSGPIIVEACILSQPWFLNPLLDELRAICGLRGDSSVYLFDLIPPAHQVQQQIVSRGRTNEVGPFSDIAHVQKHVEWAAERTTSGWRRFSECDELKAAIKDVLGAI